MKDYFYSQHSIVLIISLGQNMDVQNVILSQGHIIFCVVFVIYPWFPTRPLT